jgi:uncharacterized protein YcaQ
MEHLSAAATRRIALAAQGFADGRPPGRIDRRQVVRTLDRIAILQIDSVNVLARSHELPLFSRLGPYSRDLVPRLAYRERALFEYWGHAASYLQMADWPLLEWRRDSHLGPRRAYHEQILAEIDARGGMAASELTDGGTRTGKWWAWGEGKAALERLFWGGRLAVADRRPSFERVYDLTERVIPAAARAAPVPSEVDAKRELLVRASVALGIGTAKDLVDYYRLKLTDAQPRLTELVEDGRLQKVTVEGWKDPAYLAAGARVPRRSKARALLSPFDSLVWERDRTERLFAFRYRIEIYTPAPKRVYGYYVLPFLLGDRIVARVDLKADRAASVLRAHAVHLEPDVVAGAVMPALDAELALMAEWLGLDSVARGG